MRGALAGVHSASSRRTDRLRRRAAGAGIADRGGHARPFVAPVIQGGAILRRLCALLIAAAVAIVSFHEFTARFAPRSGDSHIHGAAIQAADLLWGEGPPRTR